jgi:hypothetical protein
VAASGVKQFFRNPAQPQAFSQPVSFANDFCNSLRRPAQGVTAPVFELELLKPLPDVSAGSDEDTEFLFIFPDGVLVASAVLVAQVRVSDGPEIPAAETALDCVVTLGHGSLSYSPVFGHFLLHMLPFGMAEGIEVRRAIPDSV